MRAKTKQAEVRPPAQVPSGNRDDLSHSLGRIAVAVLASDSSREAQQLIEAFAQKKKLETKRDRDRTLIVKGTRGHVFQYSDDRLAVMVQPKTENSRAWNKARKDFAAAGMTITQNGDAEGAATFDPKRPEQVNLAMKYAGIKQKKVATPAQLEALARYRAAKAA